MEFNSDCLYEDKNKIENIWQWKLHSQKTKALVLTTNSNTFLFSELPLVSRQVMGRFTYDT